MALVPATEFGSNSYLIAGQQTLYGTKVAAGDMIEEIFEIESTSLGLRQDSINPERSKGNSGPTKLQGGQSRVEGNVVVQIDTSHLGFWLKNLTGDTTVASSAITGGDILPSGTTYTAGTPILASTITPARQPEMLVGAPVYGGILTITFTGATFDTTNTIVIEGKDVANRPLRETLSFGSTGANVQNFTKAFRIIDSITITGPTTAGTIEVTCDPGMYKHVLGINQGLLPGMTIELVRGEVPSTYDSVLVNSGTIALGDVITMTLELLGRNAELRKAVGGGTDPTDPTGWARPPGDVAVNWGTELQLDDEVFAISAASFSLAHNLGIPPTQYYRSIIPPAPVRDSNRAVSLTTTIDYSAANDFDFKAYGEDVKAELSFASLPYGQKPALLDIELPQARLTQFPDPPVSGQGVITQDLALEGYASALGNELAITVYNAESGSQF